MPELKYFPKTRVAYIPTVGSRTECVEHGFALLDAWLRLNEVQVIGKRIIIFYDNLMTCATRLRTEECVIVESAIEETSEIRTKYIGDGQVASIPFRGEQNLERAYDELYTWLRGEGFSDLGISIELTIKGAGKELEAELIVPVYRFTLRHHVKRIQ